jgi:hypothetical protein
MLENKIDKLIIKLDQKFDKIDQRFEGLDEKFDKIDQRFDGLDKRVEKNESSLDRLIAKMCDTDHYMRTELATKQELGEVKNEMLTHIDGFITLHNRLNTELAATQSRCNRIQKHIGMEN